METEDAKDNDDEPDPPRSAHDTKRDTIPKKEKDVKDAPSLSELIEKVLKIEVEDAMMERHVCRPVQRVTYGFTCKKHQLPRG